MDKFEYVEEQSSGGESLYEYMDWMTDLAVEEGFGIIEYVDGSGRRYVPDYNGGDVDGEFICRYRKAKT
ncbi:hypothetical protein GHK03_35665 [Sinorhizobium medicae]|uniref:hypothetical protein n=1 Tax=Sinorhizobium medicae TaxID=110321 RepID=UPI001294A06F|nr:hypothetical protein [Sinorhizobium medicae]MQY01309.1 hypothetical protein [Sinorhizobium medicae]